MMFSVKIVNSTKIRISYRHVLEKLTLIQAPVKYAP